MDEGNTVPIEGDVTPVDNDVTPAESGDEPITDLGELLASYEEADGDDEPENTGADLEPAQPAEEPPKADEPPKAEQLDPKELMEQLGIKGENAQSAFAKYRSENAKYAKAFEAIAKSVGYEGVDTDVAMAAILSKTQEFQAQQQMMQTNNQSLLERETVKEDNANSREAMKVAANSKAFAGPPSSGKPLKSFESKGNDVLGGIDLSRFEPK